MTRRNILKLPKIIKKPVRVVIPAMRTEEYELLCIKITPKVLLI